MHASVQDPHYCRKVSRVHSLPLPSGIPLHLVFLEIVVAELRTAILGMAV